jgi:hypothetical protein
MKRKDIVTKLVKEGLSEKMLANMSDKQLNMLAKRMISEQQYGTTTSGANSPSVLNIPKTDQASITAAKQQKAKFMTYEGQAQVGEELSEPKLGTKLKDTDDKEAVIKRCKHTIEHSKDKGKVEDAKKILAKMTEKKKEVAEGEFKSKTEWLKSKGIIKDDDKKEEAAENADTAEQTPDKKKEKTEKKDKSTKGAGGAEYEKRLAHGNAGGFSLNEWVSDVIEKNYHPFTSKNEIMELIRTKLTEQSSDVEVETLPDFLTGDAIMSAGSPQTAEPTTKPTTKPGTKPTTRPTPKTPFQPGPGPKHNPKAGTKV